MRQSLAQKDQVPLTKSVLIVNRSVESFLNKGITQADANKRARDWEDRRKRNIELILKESMQANARQSTRKANSVLQ